MQVTDAFLQPGEEGFAQLVRSVSIGKLKTYQMYEGFKVRAHLHKLNTETLRKAISRFWTRLKEDRDEEFAKDLAQAVLVSHMGMVAEIVSFLGIPNEGGFFNKDLDARQYLTEGWQDRVFLHFRAKYPAPLLLFYINHLTAELTEAGEPYSPAASSIQK
jgi:hypothetical protein